MQDPQWLACSPHLSKFNPFRPTRGRESSSIRRVWSTLCTAYATFNLSTGQTGFLAAFDFNGDGHVDIADFGQFSVRLFTPLP